MPATISRSEYAAMFGPTTGDRLRLADTDLIVEVERDLTALNAGAAATGGIGGNAALYGEEVKFGGGKVIRDGMGQSRDARRRGGRYGHHKRADSGLHRHLQGRCRPEGRGDPQDRQGRKPGHAARYRHRHRPGHRDHRGRGAYPDRRRL